MPPDSFSVRPRRRWSGLIFFGGGGARERGRLLVFVVFLVGIGALGGQQIDPQTPGGGGFAYIGGRGGGGFSGFVESDRAGGIGESKQSKSIKIS